MADGKHQASPEKNQFCAVAGTPCGCGNNYRTICAPKGSAAAPDWSEFAYPQFVKASKKRKAFVYAKEYEAHHVLCISSCGQELFRNEDISAAVRATKWCINNKGNMLALPRWGHTVMWYCTFTPEGGSVNAAAPAPPFQSLPQHDWDHNWPGRYTSEVSATLKKLAKHLKEAGHQFTVDNLASELDAESAKWTAKLKARGQRNGGTHAAWQAASTGAIPADSRAWCFPFSMASDGFVSGRLYPQRRFNAQLTEWIKKIAAAMRRSST